MAELFGFEIKRKEAEKPAASFVPPNKEDGAVVVAEGGVYGQYIDLDGSVRTESELVNRYRDMSQYPEVDSAVEDIVNESIVADPMKEIVTLNLDDLDQPDKIKKLILQEFDTVKEKLEFNSFAYEIFRKWYIDGRLYYHFIIDEQNPADGLKEIRYIDPRKIRKIRQIKKSKVKNVTVQDQVDEYYLFNHKGFNNKAAGTSDFSRSDAGGLKISKDSIVHCTSGLTNINGDLIVGYLHKAIKPLNQLKAMEDSLVIYRISRAPERRIFYIDVGNLPKMKAEQYLRDMMTRYKNKLVYDAGTGEVRDDRKFMTMLEDFWLPRSEGGRGTEITTLPGGQNLGDLDDVIYFQRRLYKSLNVPITRLDAEAQYNFGRATEISRDEVKFAKFITRLRMKFSDLFNKILEKQLVLKGIITTEDWIEFKDAFKYDYSEDNHFAELRNTEILRDRISMLRDIDDYTGKYYSHEWVRKNVLYQTDEEMEEINKQIVEEENNPQYAGMNPEMTQGGVPPEQQAAPEAQPQEQQPDNDELPAEAGPPGIARR